MELFRSFEPEQLVARGRASGMGLTARAIAYLLYGHAQHHADVLRERYR